ncbi:MAG: LPS export ABC transporter periplasmic protein LptC [Cyanobacteria bacterium NC_groundwater_1444_Ag_S-0.65um_54_12]|nr:LPS export ABC transporter periplasmic protein LptC [Cyanobacteria bacterium NC_groundwater_1444_Ag_S-0.65um_54_12]
MRLIERCYSFIVCLTIIFVVLLLAQRSEGIERVPPPPPLPKVFPMPGLPQASSAPAVAPGVPLGTSSVRILSDFMRYDRQTKQAIAKGNVKIFQEDVAISASEAHYDQANKITNIRVPFELLQEKPAEPRTTLKGKSMTVYHNQKHAVVDGEVQMVREGHPAAVPANSSRKEKIKTAFKREDTIINAEHMDYWTSSKDAQFERNTRFIQKEKHAVADRAFLDNRKITLVIVGHVILTQIKGDWLVQNEIVDTSKPDPDRDQALSEKIVITGDHLVVDQTTSDAVMTGTLVTVTQKGKRATGKRADYKDREQTITLQQDVRIARDDGSYLTAERAVFHTESEKFEAYGAKGTQVETEFKLEETQKSAAH